MGTVRVRVTAERDGEIRLTGLPLRAGQEAEVIVLTDETEEPSDAALMAVLGSDPGWQWLRDAAEDVYTEEDVR